MADEQNAAGRTYTVDVSAKNDSYELWELQRQLKSGDQVQFTNGKEKLQNVNADDVISAGYRVHNVIEAYANELQLVNPKSNFNDFVDRMDETPRPSDLVQNKSPNSANRIALDTSASSHLVETPSTPVDVKGSPSRPSIRT